MAAIASVKPLPLTPTVQERANSELHRGLMIATIVCGIISMIPQLRVVGSLAVRGIAVLSSLSTIAAARDNKERFFLGVRAAAVITGLVGLVISSPIVVVASLVADMAYQFFAACRAFHNGQVAKGFVHLSTLLVDGLVLGSILAGSWQLMAAAAATSICAMTYLCVKSSCSAYADNGKVLDAIGYGILAVMSIAGACMVSDLYGFGEDWSGGGTDWILYQHGMTDPMQLATVVTAAGPTSLDHYGLNGPEVF